MTSLPYWADTDDASASAWNSCILGDVTLPGVCFVTASKGRDVDLKKAKGQDGFSTKDNGASAGKVNILLTITTRDEWDRWLKIRPTIDPNRPGGSRSPLEIQHPEAADRGIRHVYIVDIQGRPPTARGGKTYNIQCNEWFPQAKAAKASTKAKPAAKKKRSTEEEPTFISQLNPGFDPDFVKNLTGTNL